MIDMDRHRAVQVIIIKIFHLIWDWYNCLVTPRWGDKMRLCVKYFTYNSGPERGI